MPVEQVHTGWYAAEATKYIGGAVYFAGSVGRRPWLRVCERSRKDRVGAVEVTALGMIVCFQ